MRSKLSPNQAPNVALNLALNPVMDVSERFPENEMKPGTVGRAELSILEITWRPSTGRTQSSSSVSIPLFEASPIRTREKRVCCEWCGRTLVGRSFGPVGLSGSAIHGRRRLEQDIPEQGQRDEVRATSCQGNQPQHHFVVLEEIVTGHARRCHQTGTNVEGVFVALPRLLLHRKCRGGKMDNWAHLLATGVEWGEVSTVATRKRGSQHHGDLEHRSSQQSPRLGGGGVEAGVGSRS